MTKKVVITGGQGDIAQAIVRKLEMAGEYEVLAPGKNELDVTNIGCVEKYFEKHVPDILINNAGYCVPQSIRSADLKKIEKSIGINLAGTFYCTASALKYNPALQIVNVGSSAATKIHATWSSYCATKAAVVMATKCWAEDGLYAVVISPGRTKTKMRKSLYPDEDQNTLMLADDFAEVVMKGVRKEYPSGTHVNVNKQNVKEIIRG